MRKSGFFPRLALVNLMRNGRFYGPYLLSCGMTAAMYYILSYLTFSDIVASVRGAGYLQSLMYLGRLVVTLFSAVLLLYANSFVMKRRRRELGLYNILGLEKRHTARLMVWETLYCAAAAIVGGLAAGVLLSKLVLLLLLQLSHLPVVVDPSHACGKAWMVERMSMAAVAAGADGLLIEVHNDPPHALCDGAQSITPEQFDALMGRLAQLAPCAGREL